MADDRRILICSSAADRILREAQSSEVETGGVLAGVLNPVTIVAAGQAGPEAVRTAASYSGDVEADREELAQARREFGQSVVIVGYWHKHPDGMSSYSGQDLQQARELVRAFDDDRPLIVVIVARPHRAKAPKMYGYRICSPQDRLSKNEIRQVEDDAECVREALRNAPAVPETVGNGFWQQEDFQFYTNTVGRQRIRSELSRLRGQGWAVTAMRSRHDGRMFAECRRGEKTFQLRFPAEFPLNPPRVSLATDNQRLTGLSSLREWNSGSCLSELLAECEQVISCPRCRRVHLRESIQQETSHGSA
ncbi:MAG: Mov34/MPN/PAD-1 family protein [Phycisphaerae bacterium]